MKIITLDKKGKLVFVAQTIEDLWVIKSITDPKDKISGGSYRRTRASEDDEESARKPIFVTIEIEKIDFSSELDSLRFTGIITESNPSALAPIGEHHTLEIQLGKPYTLHKQQFFSHQLELLHSNPSLESAITLIALDDENATIFTLTNTSTKMLAKINSGKPGKRFASDFDYKDYFQQILSVVSKQGNQLIIAGPGATKKKLANFLNENLKEPMLLTLNLQNTGVSAISELFKKEEVSRFFNNSIIYKEQKVLEQFLYNLGKNNNKAIYGLLEIEQAIELGAIENMLISEQLWRKETDKIAKLLRTAEKKGTKVHIVDASHQTHKALSSFGGAIANLFYPLQRN